jgi:hypothetical protein
MGLAGFAAPPVAQVADNEQIYRRTNRLAYARLLEWQIMNTANAIGFFLLGTVMQVLPSINGSPAYAPETTQTLWLQFMGLVTGVIGGGYLVRTGFAEASVLLTRFAQRRAEAREQAAAVQGASHQLPLGGVRVSL